MQFKKLWGSWRLTIAYHVMVFVFPKTLRRIVQDELTDALHPDFGYAWQPPEGVGFKYMETAYKQGYQQAQLVFYRDGVKGWEKPLQTPVE
jgi:hypothetical protein